MRLATRFVLLATAGCCLASKAWAGFTVTATSGGTFTFDGVPMDRYDITVVNTGGDTGTQVKGLEYFYSGSRVYFEVNDTVDEGGGDPDGIPDTVNLLSTSRTRVRVSANAANNVFVGVTPTNGFAQFSPYMPGVKQFSGAIANTGVTQATGAGFQIARLFLIHGGVASFSGNIGGDIGAKVPFSTFTTPPTLRVESVTPETAITSVGSEPGSRGAFEVMVRVVDDFPDGVLGLTVNSVPGVFDLTVSDNGGVSTRDYVITGSVDATRRGLATIIPITANDGSGNRYYDSICVFALVPEPASLAVFSVLAIPRSRRSR